MGFRTLELSIPVGKARMDETWLAGRVKEWLT
jgi:hypothetical protein